MLLPFRGGRLGLEGGSLRMRGIGGRGRLILGFGPLCLFVLVTEMMLCFSGLGVRKWRVAIGPRRR